MKLSELKHEVWNDERTRDLRLRKEEVKILVDVIVDHIFIGLLKYGKVKLQSLFTLEIRKSKGRKIRNPQTKEHMYTDDYHRIGIVPSKKMKKALKNLK
ncbi:HU family DNA-binding protein [Halobacillus rhizosphaerae]|uniref:HU family DNA-binding protein n=1 Tax=Halobacillus rhizosphaerae TaxID=3064889 RepID=UPI00398B1475